VQKTSRNRDIINVKQVKIKKNIGTLKIEEKKIHLHEEPPYHRDHDYAYGEAHGLNDGRLEQTYAHPQSLHLYRCPLDPQSRPCHDDFYPSCHLRR
jgi:hypothetical protein